jgi:hypothetical protein
VIAASDSAIRVGRMVGWPMFLAVSLLPLLREVGPFMAAYTIFACARLGIVAWSAYAHRGEKFTLKRNPISYLF